MRVQDEDDSILPKRFGSSFLDEEPFVAAVKRERLVRELDERLAPEPTPKAGKERTMGVKL